MNTMNKHFYSLMVLLIVCFTVSASWNKPDKGFFKPKKVEETVSGYTRSMTSIQYGDTIFNFAFYNQVRPDMKIIERKITNAGTVDKPIWKREKSENIATLHGLKSNMAEGEWQVTSAVFKDELYLFVITNDEAIGYSKRSLEDGNWAEVKTTKLSDIKGRHNGYGNYISVVGMSAAVVNGTIFLVYQNAKGYINISYSKDLKDWTTKATTDFVNPHLTKKLKPISAISTADNANGVNTTSLLYAYLNKYYSAVYSAVQIDTTGTPIMSTKKHATISNVHDYTAVALVEGGVSNRYSTKSTHSSGECVQAFLKKRHPDAGSVTRRIQRYELKNDVWSKAENNLTKIYHKWAAADHVNLAPCIYRKADGKDIRQYIVLVYRGYNGSHPLRVAYAESDRLVWYERVSTNDDKTLAMPKSSRQYIGYVEGVPPYYVNNASDTTVKHPNFFNDFTTIPISQFKYERSEKVERDSSFEYDLGFKTEFTHFGILAEFSGTWGTIHSNKLGLEKSTVVAPEANKHGDDKAYYFYLDPIISRDQYILTDVKDNPLDTAYYFYLAGHAAGYEVVDIKRPNLIPSDPQSNFNNEISIRPYQKVTTLTSQWNEDVPVEDDKIAISKENAITNTKSFDEKIGFGEEGLFGVQQTGKFEWEQTITTSTEISVAVNSRLNEPKEPGDYKQLRYNTHWLTPTAGQDNWWVPEGDDNSNVWCVTYEVTGGITLDSAGNEAPFGDGDSPVPYAMDGAPQVSGFAAKKTSAGVNLQWSTEAPADQSTFEVQRAVATAKQAVLPYETIGTVKSTDKNLLRNEFTFVDSKPLVGETRYRVKLTGENGEVSYSTEAAFHAPESVNRIRVKITSPGLAIGAANHIQYTVFSADVAVPTKLVIYDLKGRVISTPVDETLKTGIYNLNLGRMNMARGAYLCSMKSGNFSATQKITITQ